MPDLARDPVQARRFVVAAIPGALISWNMGFELGAFDLVSYRRVFSVFVVCSVVLVATFIWPAGTSWTVWGVRLVLALPSFYIVADAFLLTDVAVVANVLSGAIVLTLPVAAWTIARLVGSDLTSLSRREQLATVAIVVVVGLLGLYVGAENDRFLTCRDFVRSGDYVPADCTG